MQTEVTLAILAVCSLTLSLILTPIWRDIFLRLNVVDRPDSLRKLHTAAVPRIGGIPIMLSYVGALAVLLLFVPNHEVVLAEQSPLLIKLLPAAGIVFITGLIDDLVGLKPWQKLLGQCIGGLWAFWMGIRITGIGGFETEWWSLPLTLFWLVGCANAFNLIDGVDGLASGVGLVAASTALLAAILQGNAALAIATIPLAGALLGFLRYNFNPASVFLGDCGSLGVGFLLGCYGILWGQKSATLLGMVAPMMALALPLLDTGLAIVRRFLCHEPIFGADRGHIHHRLLARGLNPKGVALTLYAACAIAAALSLLQSVLYHRVGGLIIILFCGVAWVGIRQLNYIEFGVARQMLTGGSFRRSLKDQILLGKLKVDLESAASLEEFWNRFCRSAVSFHFHYIVLELADGTRKSVTEEHAIKDCWQFEISLSQGASLMMRREKRHPEFTALLPLTETVRGALEKHSWFEDVAEVVTVGEPQKLRVIAPRSTVATH